MDNRRILDMIADQVIMIANTLCIELFGGVIPFDSMTFKYVVWGVIRNMTEISSPKLDSAARKMIMAKFNDERPEVSQPEGINAN